MKHALITQLEECQPSKLKVGGSSPPGRTKTWRGPPNGIGALIFTQDNVGSIPIHATNIGA